jgi:hypothetical protein
VRVSNVDTRRLAGFKYRLIFHFKLAAGREFVSNTDGTAAFLERELPFYVYS